MLELSASTQKIIWEVLELIRKGGDMHQSRFTYLGISKSQLFSPKHEGYLHAASALLLCVSLKKPGSMQLWWVLGQQGLALHLKSSSCMAGLPNPPTP